jgi:hypothetical protein
MQSAPLQPSIRIRLPFLTSIAATSDVREQERNYKYYAQMSQRAFLQYVAQQCGVDSIELVSSRDLGVRIVASSRAGNAQAVAAVSCLLLGTCQGQARPALLMVPLSHADKLREELPNIQSENGNVQILGGIFIAPAELIPVVVVPSPFLSAVEAEAWVGQAVQRLEYTLFAAETKYLSYQQHQKQKQQQQQHYHQHQQQQQLVSPWGCVVEEQQQERSNILGIQGQQARTMYRAQVLPALTAPVVTISSPSFGASSIPFWQSYPSSQSLPFSATPLTPAALLQVLHPHCGLVPAESESSGRDFFQVWSLVVHGTPNLGAQVRESIASAISMQEDLLLHAAAAVTGSANIEPATAATTAAAVPIAAEKYLETVRSDWGFAGGRLEMEAAARYYGFHLAVFDAEAPNLLQFHPRLPLLSPHGGNGNGSDGERFTFPRRETSLLYYRGMCWLLLRKEEAGKAGRRVEEMETEVVAMTGGEREREMHDLSISLQSVLSEGMSDA